MAEGEGGPAGASPGAEAEPPELQTLLRFGTHPSSPGSEPQDEVRLLKEIVRLFDLGTSPTAVEAFSSDSLNAFILYVFQRKVAITEWQSKTIGRAPSASSPAPGARPSEASSDHEDSMVLRDVNLQLDDALLHLHMQPMSAKLFRAYKATVVAAKEDPALRRNTYSHVLRWMSKLKWPEAGQGNNPSAEDALDMICGGLFDVWSAVRSKCASYLPAIIDNMGLPHAEALFLRLSSEVTYTRSDPQQRSSWRRIEGGLLGMIAIVRKFSWASNRAGSPGRPASSFDGTSEVFHIRFAQTDELLDKLPPFITDGLQDKLYEMLAHPQLSTREVATKLFATYLSRSPFRAALASLKDIVTRLHGGSASGRESGEGDGPRGGGMEEEVFLDAYEAVGLLGVCEHIIKHIPPGFLLPNWPMYFSTFGLYLAHPASTVRQATSAVFKALVTRESGNPTMLKLVLQGLAAEWKIDEGVVLAPNPFDGGRPPPTGNLRPPRPGTPGKAKGWERREGRLLTFELLLKYLLLNHAYYLFPAKIVDKYRHFEQSRPVDAPVNPASRRLSSVTSMASFAVHGGREFGTPESRGISRLASPAISFGQAFGTGVTRRVSALKALDETRPASANFDDPPESTPELESAHTAEWLHSAPPLLTQSLTAASATQLRSSKSLDPAAAAGRRPSASEGAAIPVTTFGVGERPRVRGRPSVGSPEGSVFEGGVQSTPVTPAASPDTAHRPGDTVAFPRQRKGRMGRRGSHRTLTLHEHLATANDVEPDMPFRRKASGERSPGRRDVGTLSLLSRAAEFDSQTLRDTQLGKESKGPFGEHPLDDGGGGGGGKPAEPSAGANEGGQGGGDGAAAEAEADRQAWLRLLLAQPLPLPLVPTLQEVESVLGPEHPTLTTPVKGGAGVLSPLAATVQSGLPEVEVLDADTSMTSSPSTATEHSSQGPAEAQAPLVSQQQLTTPVKPPRQVVPVHVAPHTLPSPQWAQEQSPAWVDTSLFLPFEKVLRVMFLQTTECLWSPTFELRRIAAMVLPLLTEAMYWFNPSAVERLWDAGLQHPGTALASACTLSLLSTMRLQVRLDEWHGKDAATAAASPQPSTAGGGYRIPGYGGGAPYSGAYSGGLAVPVASPPPPPDVQRYLIRALEMRAGLVAKVTTLLPALQAAARASVGLNQTFASLEVLLTLLGAFRSAIHPADADAVEALALGRLAGVLLGCRGAVTGDTPVKMLEALCQQGGVTGLNDGLGHPEAIRAHVKLVGLASPLLPAVMESADLDNALDFVPWLLHTLTQTGLEALHAKNALEALHRLFDRAGAVAKDERMPGVFTDALVASGTEAIAVLLGSRDLALDASLLRRALPCVLTIWLAAPKFRILVQILTLLAEMVPEQPEPLFTLSGTAISAATPLLLTPEPPTPFESRHESSDTEDEEDRGGSVAVAENESDESDWDSSDDGDELTSVPMPLLVGLVAELMAGCRDPGVRRRCDDRPDATMSPPAASMSPPSTAAGGLGANGSGDRLLMAAVDQLPRPLRERIEVVVAGSKEQLAPTEASRPGSGETRRRMHRRTSSDGDGGDDPFGIRSRHTME